MNLVTITNEINVYLWSVALIVLCMGVATLLSVRMRFFQVRLAKDMLTLLLGGKSSENGISSFQGFAMALGGRIGIGAIAGVATAICFGGPGAVFWMWVYAFLGAGSAFAESVLAQTWKEEINGEYRGGPAYYIEKGTGIKAMAVVFAIAATIANALTGPTIQAFNIAESVHNTFGISTLVTGLALAALTGFVIFGGMKRIGRTAEYIVPFMAIGYILLALIILAVNYKNVPGMFALIFKSAFHMEAVYGAIWGQAIIWGVKRGVYSSEAGMGSGAQASAAAEVSHPAKQGLAQSFSVYVDTIFVCGATAVMILCTGMYNVQGADGTFIVENLPGVAAGSAYTQAAIDSLLPGFGSIFLVLAIFFFAFTTLMSFGFYADCNVAYLFKKSPKLKEIQIAVKLILVAMIIFGSVRTSTVAWNFADIGVGFCSWINLIGLILLQKPAVKILKDYERQKKLGLDPVFDPAECGIKNADLWHDIVKRRYSDLLEKKKSVMKNQNGDKDIAS
ncbi:alanine/glycine:cation symporter family protein [Clostridium aminobutyricum]|uniref:Alanine:cation symporter family protein n=1 Tax=Clostridium aminobutyricum TaxID=33953 RepID=A0A939DAL5_CLOAM|nr:alanine/glycine:cation symporter family protein [Clostridium aminobutyricum]MBN7773798.1 alanine:cation symporter family protein [Clostridium aminobutyricum]